MKVALVRPRYKTHLITPPLGIGYIAAALRDKYNVVVHDFHFDVAMGVYSLDAVKSVVTASSYDFIMIGGVSPDYYRLKEIHKGTYHNGRSACKARSPSDR